MADNHDEVIEHYNRFHAAVYGPVGALDRKTRHLICLGAALGQTVNSARNMPLACYGNSRRVMRRSMRRLALP